MRETSHIRHTCPPVNVKSHVRYVLGHCDRLPLSLDHIVMSNSCYKTPSVTRPHICHTLSDGVDLVNGSHHFDVQPSQMTVKDSKHTMGAHMRIKNKNDPLLSHNRGLGGFFIRIHVALLSRIKRTGVKRKEITNSRPST